MLPVFSVLVVFFSFFGIAQHFVGFVQLLKFFVCLLVVRVQVGMMLPGQDYDAELHLSLREAATTHQQTLTVNGKNIRITIYAGVENDQRIKLKGHGAPGVNGGPNGDLYITFKIAGDPRFRRSGSDLHTTEDLDLYTAVLGGETTINTLTGKVKLKVAPETQNGTKVRLKGKGFPVYKQEGQHGDLYVTWQVKIPTNLSEKEKELFTQLSKLK